MRVTVFAFAVARDGRPSGSLGGRLVDGNGSGAGPSRMLVDFRAHDEPVRINGQVVGKTSYAGAVGVYRGN